MMKRIVAALAGLFALALPGAALAQCSGIFTAGYFCGNSAAGGGLASAASPTAMFDRAFGGTNNSTVVRLGGVWTVLSSANNGVWITSVAGVPSISSTLPNAVQDNITRLGTIANIGAPLGATFGGTAQSTWAQGDILYASAANTLARLAATGTNNALLSGTAPSWGKIGLTTHVSGQLPLANGGCNGTTAATCLNNIMPTPTRAGDVAYWNGSAWVTLPGNNSGTSVLSENASGVPSWTANTSAFTITPQHRITLASVTPVMAASQAAKTTVFVTPYAGNIIPIYDGSNMLPTAFAETSQATTDATKSPAAVAASSVYDIFCWIDTGPTNRCTRGPTWTNTTTRSAGTALVLVNGIYLNNASITNGPAASRGTYVGSICSDGSSQINYVFGAAASGGTAANFCVWNAYNRVNTGTVVTDSGANYTYSSATVRQARASAGNQISFLLGLAEDTAQFSYTASYSLIAGTGGTRTRGGVGFDTTSAFSRPPFYVRNNVTTVTAEAGGSVAGQWQASIGVHTIAALESDPDGTSANTFNLGSDAALEATIRN